MGMQNIKKWEGEWSKHYMPVVMATGLNVLDVGCRRFPRGQTSIDLHPESNASVIGDACNMTMFEDDQFDVAVSVELIEHVDHPIDLLRELARVSKLGLAVTTQNLSCWLRLFITEITSADHIYGWNMETWKNLLHKVFPNHKKMIDWYDRYPKWGRWFRPQRFFRENMKALVSFTDNYQWLFHHLNTILELRPPAYEYSDNYDSREVDYTTYNRAKKLISTLRRIRKKLGVD